MKRQIFLILAISISLTCFSQTNYETGYFINNLDQKIECLIKNTDKQSNPTEFKYRLSESTETITMTIDSVKEFGMINISKYIRDTVQIDRSSESIDDLGYQRNPTFNIEVLFLKVLVEGKANLYSYNDKKVSRYFYSSENSDIKQLVYKSYLNSKGQIAKNKYYKQQLLNELKCQIFSTNSVTKLRYKQSDLINFFVKYNECNNTEFVNHEKKPKRDSFNFTIRPGLKFLSLKLRKGDDQLRNIDFKNELGYRIGFEFEWIIPHFNNKWGIVVEPTFQLIKSEKDLTNINTPGYTTNLDYKSIEVPLSLKYSFFLGKKSKIFTKASYIGDFSLNSSFETFRPGGQKLYSYDAIPQFSYAIGSGYKYKDRLSLEVIYQFGSKYMDNEFNVYKSTYKTLSLVFGYTIF